MNEEIMELIQPYMCKVVDYWCIVECSEKNNSNKSIHKLNESMFNLTNSGFTFGKEYHIDKILWHYDITSVLKYINDKKFYIRLWSNWKLFAIYDDYMPHNNTYKDKWYIPNKPLHLFIKEEEKDLLELLKKLWKQ